MKLDIIMFSETIIWWQTHNYSSKKKKITNLFYIRPNDFVTWVVFLTWMSFNFWLTVLVCAHANTLSLNLRDTNTRINCCGNPFAIIIILWVLNGYVKHRRE